MSQVSPLTISIRLLGIAGVALAVLAGCGDSDDKETASSVEGFDSPYCVTARKSAVHELNGGGDGACARGGPPH